MDLNSSVAEFFNKMNTIKPIEFIMPNPILLLTEWKTANINEHEITFSMEHLYLLINLILKNIFKSGLPASLISDEFLNKPAEVLEENKLEIIDHYGLAIITSTALLFLAIFVPIIWILSWCFCCTTNSAKRSRYNYQSGNENLLRNRHSEIHRKHRSYEVEKPCDCCIRPIFSLMLLSCLVLCFIFIVCSFVTNDFVHDGIQNLPKDANNSLADFEIYLNNTQYELDILFKTNFAQLESQIHKNLNISGEIVKNKIAIISEASSVDNLTQIVSNLQPILQDLQKLINHTNELKFLSAQLRSKILRTKQDLEEFIRTCQHEICLELEKKYHLRHSISLPLRIENLPKLSPIIEKIHYLLSRNIIGEIHKGKERLDQISKDIQTKVNEVIPKIRTNIAQANKALIENVDDINSVLAQPISYIRIIQGYLSTSNDFIQRHNYHIHYVGLLCTLILFIILFCYFFGLLCGVCNDQPTRYNFRNRSKKSECFFYFGMTLFFLSFTLLLSVSTIAFLFGGLNDRSFCFYLENVTDDHTGKVLELLQTEFDDNNLADHNEDLKQIFSYLNKVGIVDILQRCHQNQSLFNVLQLSIDQNIKIYKDFEVVDLNLSKLITFKEKSNIQNYLNEFLNKLNIDSSNIVLLSSEGKELLQTLKEMPLETLNFSSYSNLIKQSITPIDLEIFAKKLENESYRFPDYEIDNIAKLRNIVLDLRSSKELVNIITNKIENLTKNAERIELKSHFNGKSLRDTLDILLKQASDAQHFINKKGRTEIRNVLRNFIQDLSLLLTQYSQHVEQRVKNEIGRCEPVSRAYNHTVSALCDNVILPFTAYWFSVTFTLLVFIPSTMLICILNSLFKRVKRSSRRESILIIDHYEDDDIPMSEIDKRSSRRPVVPSAPNFVESHSEEETWSPGAIPQHLFSRPPPYNF